MKIPTALVVEDDENFRTSLAELVEREGFATRQAASVAEARAVLEQDGVDVALIDLGLPDGDGLDLLREEGLAEQTDFIVVTGNATLESAVDALRDGAIDYLTKPIDRARLRTVLANVARTRALKQEVSSLREELRELGRFGPMVGRSPAMQRVYDLVARVAPTGASVFITGESGTGKELVAETVHSLSGRRDAAFLAVNCGAMSATIIESELFGHEKGSFTGADRRRHGYFEEAEGGTLFLDEISEMPIGLQVKLLRVLETGTILRVGSNTPVDVDVRVIAASNRVPEEAIAEGALREDLFYRLNVFPIVLPPLCERAGDIDVLAQHFLDSVNSREGTAKRWTEEALIRLRSLSWPGNVRQLKNVVERAAILTDEAITPDTLPQPEPGVGEAEGDGDGPTLQVRVGSSIADVERRLILATLDRLGGDKKRAAEMLGVSLKTLYNRLNVYGAQEKGD